MKSSNEMLQNLPYFIFTNTPKVAFWFSFRATLFFSLMNALVYVEKTMWVFIFQKYGKF